MAVLVEETLNTEAVAMDLNPLCCLPFKSFLNAALAIKAQLDHLEHQVIQDQMVKMEEMVKTVVLVKMVP